jgi:hypothetical protein
LQKSGSALRASRRGIAADSARGWRRWMSQQRHRRCAAELTGTPVPPLHCWAGQQWHTGAAL